MKTLSALRLALAVVSVSVRVSAGATFDVTNLGLTAPVYDWTGGLLEGPDWRAELYGGNSTDSLSPSIGWNTRERVLAPFIKPGHFRGGDDADVPAVHSGGKAWLQVRVWNLTLGANYEETVARGLGGYGQSVPFYAQGGDPFGSPPTATQPLRGLTCFSVLEIVPEPSAWALLLLSLPLAFVGSRWRRRRRASPGSPDS